METKKTKKKNGTLLFEKGNKVAEKWTAEKAEELADDLFEWITNKKRPSNIFFEEYLCIEKKIPIDTINYLSKKFSWFSERINRSKKIQEIKLKKYGCEGDLNSAMTKFILNVNHGLVERKQIEQIDTDIKPIETKRLP